MFLSHPINDLSGFFVDASKQIVGLLRPTDESFGLMKNNCSQLSDVIFGLPERSMVMTPIFLM
jgi:hypothetical protein